MIVPAGREEAVSEFCELKTEPSHCAAVDGADQESEGCGASCESARPANRTSAISSGKRAWPLCSIRLAELSFRLFKSFPADRRLVLWWE